MIISQTAFKSISFLSNSLKFNNCGVYFKTIYSFSEQSGKDQPNQRYKYPFNFNREEYKGYIKKVEKAQKMIDQIQSTTSIANIPRRKRRIYDRPRYDTNITDYSAWRLYDIQQLYMKHWEHSLPVNAKLKLQPKWVVHAFGLGLLPRNHHRSVHREYVFQDNNLSRFLLYQFRNTTDFKPNEPDYDYQNQQNIRKQMQKVKRMDPKQFWQSQQYFEFRVNSTSYAQYPKFCKWIKQTIQTKKSQESYQSFINNKFGIAFSYNKKTDQEFYKPRKPFIIQISPQSFEQIQIQKKVQKDKNKKQSKQKKQKQQTNQPQVQKVSKPTVQLQRKLGEQFRKQKEKQVKKRAQKEAK